MDNLDDIIDSQNRMVCKAHRREVCHVCCCDHRVTNEITKEGKNADVGDILARHELVQNAEIKAMTQLHAAQGGRAPIVLGTETAQRLYDRVAIRPNQKECAQCGMTSDTLLVCSRCKEAKFCSKECQTKHYPYHKGPCKAAAIVKGEQQSAVAGSKNKIASANENRISWTELKSLGGSVARDKVLELRILSQATPFIRHSYKGKDHKGDVHTMVFISGRFPPGFALGKVMRWRNPHFNIVLDGARIEEGDLANISVH